MAEAFKHRAAASEDADEMLHPADQRKRLELSTVAREPADDRDGASPAYRCNRPLERAAAAHFDNEMSPAAGCHAQHLRIPLRRRAIVDGVVGTERASALELRVIRGSDDHLQTDRLGELQRPGRDAARTEQQDSTTGLQPRVHEQSVPRGNASARQSRSLYEIVAFRD